MSYTLCPRCGQKALSIATQCPHCGDPFETRHSYEGAGSRPRKTPVALILVALGVIYLGVDDLRHGSEAPADASPPLAMHADPIPPPPPELQSPSPPELRPETSDTSAAPERPSTEGETDPQERRYTTIWANVREARRPMAPVVTVLQPGEPVLVDSLSEEWYRVVADGQKLGYVYRELVDTAPPVTQN
jgi:ribosomal protein L37E